MNMVLKTSIKKPNGYNRVTGSPAKSLSAGIY